MENEATPQPETFAQALARLKSEYDINDSEIARRIDVHVSTVNTWVHGKRTPRADAVHALAKNFPKFSEEELSAAAGRKKPGPLSPDRTERLIKLFEGLTEEQQAMKEIELRALNDANRL